MSMKLQNPEEIKVFILYLMERIGYPLSYTDIGSIVIRDGVTDYFAFFEQFDELLRAGHVAEVDENGEPVPGLPRDDEEAADPAKMYVITKSGKLIADGLSENVLMAAVREKSYLSAMRHLSLEKRGAVVDQSFERDGTGYVFHCSVKDKDGPALDVSVRVDTVYQLNRMRLNFDENPDVVLRGIHAILTGNVNYLFEN
ncbi:MAG: DUF4364 family protein [Clostridia bacterium]|nr:DUF4364 family protein [Clostridia bacterium]MBQ6677025.1 DUF4364 family protein [Clostridia bacterium]MBR3415262.1 DUF4364 family protein [Clostridia bacterium]MBR6914954.1 DUF4364 family protein [Clostridia bacterium]